MNKILINIFSIFGFIFTSIYYTLSGKSFLRLCKENVNLNEISFYKILFNYMISFFNFFYSDFLCYTSIYACNIYGLFYFLVLLVLYIFFEFRVDLTDSILNILMIGTTSISFSYYFNYILIDEDIYGCYLICTNFVGLLYFIYENYNKYKNGLNNSYSFYMNILYTSAAFCWYILGILYIDFYIKLTFGIEIIFGIIVIIFNKCYDKKFKDYSSIGNLNEDKIKNMQIASNNNIEFVEEKKLKYENL